MVTYTYGELEGFWDSAGGNRALGPIMAAIALAESGGNPDAQNDHDNNGTQSSFGLWQVSNGTHMPPIGNWNDPNANAAEAVKIEHDQGLRAWGTYDSGAYKQFLKGNVPPVTGPPATTTSWWENLLGPFGTFFSLLPGQGGGSPLAAFEGLFKFFSDITNPAWWMRVAKGGIGVILMIAGAWLMFHESAPAQAVKSTVGKAKEAGEIAAAAA